MNVVSFGGGTNSTAMIIGMYLHKIPIDLILFADTGGEQPHTYEFIETFNGWLEKHGLPQITSVQYHDKDGNRLTLEQECINSGTLPSIAYGFKRCSLKHKIGTQEKFCNNYQPCRDVWASGQRVHKFIGYDAGETRRIQHAAPIDEVDKKYEKHYPLYEWGWTREECVRVIERAGLPKPGKSSCFFCPLHEEEGNTSPVGKSPGPVPEGHRPRTRSRRYKQDRQGPGARLVLGELLQRVHGEQGV